MKISRYNTMEIMILHLLSQRDFYGYELVQSINRLSDGYFNILTGSLYPVLYKLTEEGFISEYKKQEGKRLIRVYYHIEDTGLKHLDTLLDDYYAANEAVDKVLGHKESADD